MRLAGRLLSSLGLAMALLTIESPAFADSAQDAPNYALQACLTKGANLSICQSIQDINDRAQKITKDYLKRTGLDNGVSAALAGTVQTLAERRLRIKTSIEGVASALDVSPEQVSLSVLWKF
jgi:hypothetical protein